MPKKLLTYFEMLIVPHFTLGTCLLILFTEGEREREKERERSPVVLNTSGTRTYFYNGYHVFSKVLDKMRVEVCIRCNFKAVCCCMTFAINLLQKSFSAGDCPTEI